MPDTFTPHEEAPSFGAVKAITLTVNGQPVTREAPAHLSLLDFLRDNLNLKGAKECCAVGECGACTVMIDGDLSLIHI